MSEKIIKSRFSLTHDTYENWSAIGDNFIPAAGEIIIYDADAENVSPRIKIGDGVRAINDLEFLLDTQYIAGNGIEIDADNHITNTGVLNVSVPDSDPETGEIPIGSFKANINGTDTSISINGVETAYTASMTNIPGALTWDGSIDDRYYVEMQNEGGFISVGFVHITDEFPATLNLMLQMGGEESESIPVSMCVNIEGSVEYGETTLTVSEDGFIMGDEEAFIIYVPTDNYTHPEMPVTFAKKGWYGMGYYYIIEGQYIPMMNMPSIMKIPMVSFTSSSGDMSKYFTTERTISRTSFVGDTLTWDGNTNDRVYIEITETPEGAPEGFVLTQRFVKMSDSIPTEEDFKNGCSVSMYGNMGEGPQSNTEELTYDGMVAEGLFLGDGCIQAGQAFIIPYDNYTLTLPEDDNNTPFVFSEAGTYFVYATMPGMVVYTTSLTIPGYNFSTATYKTTDVIKTEHLPEHLRFGEITTMTGGSDTLTWDGNTNGLIVAEGILFKVSDDTPTLQDMKDGISYIITDGNTDQEIIITAEEISEAVQVNDGVLSISSYVAILTIPSMGYPAGVYFSNLTLAGSPTYTKSFTINGYNGFKTTITEFKTIDPKYLPDGFGGGSGGGTGLPTVSTSDNNKTVKVVNGEWEVTKLSYNDLTNTPSFSKVATSGSYNDLTNTPTLSKVATSGSYNDLKNTPTLSKVATSGSYNDLKNTPIPTASSSNEGAFLRIVNGQWTIAHLPSVEEGEF